VLHLACLYQVFDGSGGILNGSVGVDAMLVEEVNGVRLQTRERGFNDQLNVVGVAVERCPFTVVVGIGSESELGGDDDLFAERGEGFADQLFIDVGPIDFGGIKEVYASFNGGSDELDGL
jgi:hypothetical protein